MLISGEWKIASKNGEGGWAKSARSSSMNCVEVRMVGQAEAFQVRDSKNPDADILTFTRAEWEAFLAGAKDGEFDL